MIGGESLVVDDLPLPVHDDFVRQIVVRQAVVFLVLLHGRQCPLPAITGEDPALTDPGQLQIVQHLSLAPRAIVKYCNWMVKYSEDE